MVDSGSVTEAARVLGVSQPSVSRMIKHMEDQSGMRLFTLKNGRLQATEEARTIYPAVDRVFLETLNVQRTIREVRAFRSERIRIACVPTLSTMLVPNVVAAFREKFPDTRFVIQTLFNYEAVELVASNKVDIGLVFVPPRPPNIPAQHLFDIQLVCVLPKAHPLAKKERLTGKDLSDVPLVTLARDLPSGARLHEDFFGPAADRNVVVEVNLAATAYSLMRAGVGVALFDILTFQEFPQPEYRAIPLEPATTVQATLVRSPTSKPSRFVETFSELLVSYAKAVADIARMAR